MVQPEALKQKKNEMTGRTDGFGGMGSSRGEVVTDVAEGGQEEVKDAG